MSVSKWWKKLKDLETTTTSQELEKLAQEWHIPVSELTQLQQSLVQDQQIKMNLSSMEWFQLNAVLDELTKSDYKTTWGHALFPMKKAMMSHPFYQQYLQVRKRVLALDNPVEHVVATISGDQWIETIEEAIREQQSIHVTLQDGKMASYWPHKLLHLEGELSLVGEDTHDRCLTAIKISEVLSMEAFSGLFRSERVSGEIEEFIQAIRRMYDKETRLILKIHDPETADLMPDYHFLGRPCLVTNPVGDLIWAAYVEPCAELYDWLMQLADKVEILDPTEFKQEFAAYCAEKWKKIA